MNKGENIVVYPGIGPVQYKRNRKARHLAIRISPSGEVRVTVPGNLSMKRAETFLKSKEHWIIKKRAQIHSRIPPAVGEGDLLVVQGKAIPVIRKPGEESVERSVWRILLPLAKEYLPGRVDTLAREHGFAYEGIRIRGMKSRWGSCSAKNRINLNSWLMMLPDHLSDYVILHELVHTRHKNHGRGFWEALDQVTGGRARSLRKELREYRILSVHPVKKFHGEGD
jgi:predicted metal-dependent hydrolase